MKKNVTVVRVLAHTQIRKVANWGQKKPHVLEIQVRGGAGCGEVAYHLLPSGVKHMASPMSACAAHCCR